MNTLDFILSMEAANIAPEKIILALKEAEMLRREDLRQRVKKSRNNNKPVTTVTPQLLQENSGENFFAHIEHAPAPDSLFLESKEESKEESKKERKESKITGSRFSLTQLPDDWKSYCKAKRPDLSPEETFDAFRDWWIAQPGGKGLKADWFATWRTWVRNQKSKTSGNYNDRPIQKKPTAVTIGRRADSPSFAGFGSESNRGNPDQKPAFGGNSISAGG